MGYYVEMIKDESNVVLKSEHQEEIFKLWKELNSVKNNHLKNSGTWSGGKRLVYCYPFMASDYDKKAKSVTDILKELGFTYSKKKNNDIKIKGYNGKSGAELLFFKTISHLIEPKSKISWNGEDNYKFVWHFDNKDLVEMPLASYSKILLHEEFSKEIISKNKNKKQIKL